MSPTSPVGGRPRDDKGNIYQRILQLHKQIGEFKNFKIFGIDGYK